MQWPKGLYPKICISINSQEIHLFPPTSFEEWPCCARLLGMPLMQASVISASTMLKTLLYNCKVHFHTQSAILSYRRTHTLNTNHCSVGIEIIFTAYSWHIQKSKHYT